MALPGESNEFDGQRLMGRVIPIAGHRMSEGIANLSPSLTTTYSINHFGCLKTRMLWLWFLLLTFEHRINVGSSIDALMGASRGLKGGGGTCR